MATLFDCEIDIHLVYEPPMQDSDFGIVLTRGFQLPFAPCKGLFLHNSEWDELADGQGVELTNVVWDMNRCVFLLQATYGNVDFPVACIPEEIRSWLGRGWEWGSYMDQYDGGDSSDDPKRKRVGQYEDITAGIDSDVVERLHTIPRNERPTAFNVFFDALIRQMAVVSCSSEIAYAMDKAGRYLGHGRVEATDENAGLLWYQYQKEYCDMGIVDRLKWQDKVSRYPTLESVVLGRSKKQSNARAGAK